MMHIYLAWEKYLTVNFVKYLCESDFKIPYALTGLVFWYDHIKRDDPSLIEHKLSEGILSMYLQILWSVLNAWYFCPAVPTRHFLSLSFLLLFLLKLFSLIILIEEAGGMVPLWKSECQQCLQAFIKRPEWRQRKCKTSSSRPELRWWFPERIYQY